MTIKVSSFKELGELYQLRAEKSKVPVGTITNAQGITSEFRSKDGMTVLEKNIPLRRF